MKPNFFTIGVTSIMASILLLGCTDSKENPAVANKKNSNDVQNISRSVAQYYQVVETKKGDIDCLVDVTRKESKKVILKSGQQVRLSNKESLRVTVEGAIWLRVLPSADANTDDDEYSCYVQTLYLDPIADYIPE